MANSKNRFNLTVMGIVTIVGIVAVFFSFISMNDSFALSQENLVGQAVSYSALYSCQRTQSNIEALNQKHQKQCIIKKVSSEKSCKNYKNQIEQLAKQYNRTCLQFGKINCTDSDGGNNKFIAGTMKQYETDEGQRDVCMDSNRLKEFYCSGKKGIYKVYNCENGCGEGVCIQTGVRTASVLDVPLPENSKCFYHINQNLPECSKYYNREECNFDRSQCSKIISCPKFYNPVYDSNGIFYPSACWAENFGVTNYNYGYSPQLNQFINDLWFTKKRYSNKYFKVPSPNIEFTYQGSGLLGFRNGVFLRSVLWKNKTNHFTLDYNINTEDGTQQSTSFVESTTFVPVYGINLKSLLVFVMFDDAYPENILLEWTDTYEPLMNDYIRKKQKVPNPIQYDIIPIVIGPPQGVERPSSNHLYFSQEEMQKVFDAATSKIGESDFDVFILSPVFLNGFGGYLSGFNNMEFIDAPLTPPEPYSSMDKQKGLNALAAFQSMFLTISHEVLHAVGLKGDHVPIGYSTYYLDTVGQDVDPITGKRRAEVPWCDFYGTSPDYYAVEIPNNLEINVNQEPPWLYKSESSTGPCLSGLYNNEWLKDYDNDGRYEIMYKNNLIGKELQRTLGWIDIDNDGVTELIDNNPYGGYKWFSINEKEQEFIGPFNFTFIEYKNVGNCEFGKIKLENNLVGLVPLECVDFDDEIVNIYLGLRYYWKKIDDVHYGTVLLARLAN